MEIEEIKQKSVKTINKRNSKNGVETTPNLLLMHLTEEVGELALQLNNKNLKRRQIDLKNVGEEISDCILLLTAMADKFNINLDKAISEKIKEIKNKIR